MDPRVPRTWFLSVENWSSASVKRPDRYDAIQTKAAQKARHGIVAQMFLVRAPLTFGHSQLVIEFSGAKQSDEAKRFRTAVPIIETALSVFGKVLNDKILKKPEFKSLAKLTLTRGEYLKTLILRASADEKDKNRQSQYKVHLVPYFTSHASRCHKRYSTIHNLDPIEKGGLLGWLGERETEVDKWQVGTHPFAYTLDQIVNENLKMPDLAKALCEGY